jgi:UDP-N-acetylmuramoyl-tripeptide--D-alanyl-D-alanine ligase
MLMLSEAAAAIGARHLGPDVKFLRVTTDSRQVEKGDLFVALKGDRFDGHGFVASALAQGAAAALVSADSHLGGADAGLPLLVVDDTRLGLGRLAAAWRQRFACPLVAITGSNGKTTVKEMLSAILAAQAGAADKVLATQGNLNNDIGMPLTLLRLRDTHRYAVIEMGMNHVGEIDYLTRIARPDVALVNNAAPAHIGNLGSLETIARAKGEIYAGLTEKGTAIVNADDAFADYWQGLNPGRRVIRFGLRGGDVSADCRMDAAGSTLTLRTPLGGAEVRLALPGEHNALNALAATAAAIACGTRLESVVQGLSGFAGVKGRLQKKPALHGATLIDDSYNANPASVQAAIAVLARQGGKRILVLGDMGELGDQAESLHRETGAAAKAAGIDALLALGDMSRFTVEAFGPGAMHFEFIEGLLAELENRLGPDVTVLVKGSRFMQMERVVKSFASPEAP